MSENQMIVTGARESFIARVLIKKLEEAEIGCSFVRWTIDELSAVMEEAGLITLLIDGDERPADGVLHYLADTMEEKSLRMIVVGEQNDIAYIRERVDGEHIHKTFVRPVDNAVFVKTVTEYFTKLSSGDFQKRIMIVDDDPHYLTMVREWLKGTYKVFMANSGLQAIKLLGRNRVDLILLDHEMPVTSGPEVLEMLRSDPDTTTIPVIFLTGKSDKQSVMAVVALRPEGYFLKGIQKDELLDKLKEFFVLHR